MIEQKVYNYNYSELVDWLRNEAGSSNHDYFHAKKTGGLKLQQVPEEYASLLLYLKSKDIKTYLSLGIGNGGSFSTECFFMQNTLMNCQAVDNLAYGQLISQNESEIQSYIDELIAKKVYSRFVNSTSDKFFETIDSKMMFDCIFIDADHSYEGAKKDYENSLKHINSGGIIIFHDIVSVACPGIIRLWNEVKKGRVSFEFIASKNCGIGVIEL